MNIKERKIEMREQMTKRRDALDVPERNVKTGQLNRSLRSVVLPRLEEAGRSGKQPTLFAYMPYRSEADITPLIEACWERGYKVLVPKSIPENRVMRLYDIRSYDDLATGQYGIREPLDSVALVQDITQIDVILVPGLAFDLKFGRLGYGGGYYDRFMQRYIQMRKPRPYLVAAAFDLQMVPEVPYGMFDFRIDQLVTESKSLVRPFADDRRS